MHSMRPRPICRAHNTFSPSVALWQHFVAPNQHLPRRPLQSLFTTEAAQSRDSNHVSPSEEEPPVQPASASSRVTVRLIPFGTPPSEDWGNVRHLALDSGLLDETAAPPAESASASASSQETILPEAPVKKNWITVRRLMSHPRLLEETAAPPNTRHSKKDATPYRGRGGQDVGKLLLKAHAAFDSSQDYEGVVVQAVHTVPIAESRYPWVVQPHENIKTVEERLNLEIQKFHEYVRPSPVESVARKHVVEQVRRHVRQRLPDHVLEVFGSERTGISFAKSDIDLRLVSKEVYSDTTRTALPPEPLERTKMKRDLRKLHQHLNRTCRRSYLMPTLRWARYPLISLQDRASGLDVQIVLSNDTALSRQFMQRYMEENPHLGQLYSVIKATLDVRGLTDVFRGGVGSYPLFMMIVASLKHHPSSSNDNAAGALLNFLSFWSKFRTEAHGLSIEPPEYLAKVNLIMNGAARSRIEEGINTPLPPWMLSLRDPADETNDLGRKIVAWKHIQKTFANLLRKMRADMKTNTRPSLLAPLVGPMYGLEKTQRKRLSKYGSSLSEAGRQHTSSDAFEQMMEGPGATMDGPALSHLADVEAVAMSIESGGVAKEPTEDAGALENAMEAAQHGDKEGMQSWLTDIEQVSEHKETAKAFSNLLGLNKTASK